MRSLYSKIEPYKQYTLSVDNNHTLYIEESGNPNGLPIVFASLMLTVRCDIVEAQMYNYG